MTLDRFYPIFDSAEWLRRTLALGVNLVQVRIKRADEAPDPLPEPAPGKPVQRYLDDAALAGELIEARDLCRAHGATLIVNDHWQLALDLDCDFIHLGQEDLDDADLAAIRRAGARLGVSTHDHTELDRALSVDPDYIALGPVWPTILKKMPWAPQGLDRVGEWKRLVGNTPLCAIGGMTPERGRAALAAGADLVSVVTDITLNDTPETRIREWIAATRQEA